MRLLLMKICAIAAVNLVAGGAEGRNVTTKSGYQSISDGEEERVFDFAEFGQAMERFHSEVSANPGSLGNMLQSALKSERFTGFFKESYDHARSPDEVYRELEFHGKEVQAAAQHRYADFVKQTNLNIHSTLRSTLAESVHPTTVAESVYPTVADPVSTRFQGKGLAEVVGGQHSSKVSSVQDQYLKWLQNGVPPIKILKLLELDKIGDTFLQDLRMFQWTSYVTKYNHKYSEKSTTVFDALKEGGVKEETMVNMVFSWNSRRESVTNKVYRMSLSVDKKMRLNKLLNSYQEIARMDILNGLKESWAYRKLTPSEVLDILGIQPNLGLDVLRLAEWFKYMESRRVSMNEVDQQSILQIGPFLQEKGFTFKQLKLSYSILETMCKGPLITKLKEWTDLRGQAQKEQLKRKWDTS